MKKGQASAVAIILVVLVMIFVAIIVSALIIKYNLLSGLFVSQPQVVYVQKPSTQASQEVTCNYPYIKVGNDCCLDSNHNGICDKDETNNNVNNYNTGNNQYNTCDYPYIKRGTTCCLDDDRDGICDKDENYNNRDGLRRYSVDKHTIDSPFSINSVEIYQDELDFRLENQGSQDLTVTKIRVDDCDTKNLDATINANDDKSLTLNCDFGSSVNSDVEIDYTISGSNSTQTASGKIRGTRDYDSNCDGYGNCY